MATDFRNMVSRNLAQYGDVRVWSDTCPECLKWREKRDSTTCMGCGAHIHSYPYYAHSDRGVHVDLCEDCHRLLWEDMDPEDYRRFIRRTLEDDPAYVDPYTCTVIARLDRGPVIVVDENGAVTKTVWAEPESLMLCRLTVPTSELPAGTLVIMRSRSLGVLPLSASAAAEAEADPAGWLRRECEGDLRHTLHTYRRKIPWPEARAELEAWGFEA